MNGKVKDPDRRLLTGSQSCTAHICGNEKSVPGTKHPKGQNCECTEWKVSAQVSCSRKDEAGACVEWLGECKKTEGALSCPAGTQSCVAIHCHPAEKKG
ncbi:MAG: hypothetical protein HYV15_01595 [Elusimicrobia bacterium]|nr:hypothetical protein [Elusimicrobiota bacterium]